MYDRAQLEYPDGVPTIMIAAHKGTDLVRDLTSAEFAPEMLEGVVGVGTPREEVVTIRFSTHPDKLKLRAFLKTWGDDKPL